MRVERLGEKAMILRELPCPAHELARALNHWRLPDGISDQAPPASLPVGFQEAVASYETVGLYFEKVVEDTQSLRMSLEALLPLVESIQSSQPKRLEIPVCYEFGEDLEDAARALAMTSGELIGIHGGTEYQCFAVGFSPGFAYLGYLEESIGNLPRLPSPRKRVEPGSVGITGRQTAVYPSATPGGWNLIGRCPLELVDVETNYFPIEAGDQVKFRRIDEAEFGRLKGERL